MTVRENDRQFCWERVSESNCVFQISRLFAGEEFADPLLALYALFASIDKVNISVSDEQVARRKLEWWLCELQPETVSNSRHPVVRHLYSTGVADLLSAESIEPLFLGANARLDMRPVADLQELRSLCSLMCQSRYYLDFAVCAGKDEAIPDHWSASNHGGLLELIRESACQSGRAFWWVPLNLLAQFRISRRQLVQNCESEKAQSLFHAIFRDSARPYPEENASLSRTNFDLSGQLHAHLIAALKSRQLDRVSKQRPTRWHHEMNKWRVSDVFAAWSLARKLKGGPPSL